MFFCPYCITDKILLSYGFTNTYYLPLPFDLAKLHLRQVTGPARHLIHNAGLVDSGDCKVTREMIKAFFCLVRRDVCLTVRLQKLHPLHSLD